MQIIFIYDSNELRDANGIDFIFNIESIKTEFKFITNDKKNLFDFANEIVKYLHNEENKENIIIIPQYLQCADKDFNSLSDNAGIALIKFLRLAGVKQHIALISPFSTLELVQQNPGNLILTSKGISIEKYHYDFYNKKIDELQKLVDEKFCDDYKEKLKPYILTEFRLPESERHNWANWWGIKQLIDVHKRIFPDEEIEYSETLRGEQNNLKNQQALFLYDHDWSEFFDAVKNIEAERIFNKPISEKQNEINRISNVLNEGGRSSLTGRLNYYQNEIAKRKYYDEEDKRNLENQLNTVKAEIENLEFKQQSLEKEIKEFEKQKKEFLKKGSQSFEDEEVVLSSIRNLVKTIRSEKIKILYIDDQANDGWADILKLILIGNKNENEIEVIPSSNTQIEKDFKILEKEVLDKISQYNPDIVLLDLRLNRIRDENEKIENLSGVVLLNCIKNKFPNIPVVITTASNKSNILKELKHLGCDAFWTKEGIDQKFGLTDSAKNYSELIDIISFLLGKDFSTIKIFYDSLEKLKIKIQSRECWWNKPNRLSFDTNLYTLEDVDNDELLQIMKEAIDLYKKFLTVKYEKKNDTSNLREEEIDEREWFWSSLIIQHAAKIIELIFKLWNKKYVKYENFALQQLKNVCDVNGLMLYTVRGFSSHTPDCKKLTIETAKQHIDLIFHYLDDRRFKVNLAKLEDIHKKKYIDNRDALKDKFENNSDKLKLLYSYL